QIASVDQDVVDEAPDNKQVDHAGTRARAQSGALCQRHLDRAEHAARQLVEVQLAVAAPDRAEHPAKGKPREAERPGDQEKEQGFFEGGKHYTRPLSSRWISRYLSWLVQCLSCRSYLPSPK